MRRCLIPALMISLLLTGCGGGAEEKLKAQRETFAAAEELTFTAEATANLGQELFSCTMECRCTPEELTMVLTAPESLAGVKTRIADGETVLEYGDVSLGIGAARPDELSPISGVQLLMEALRGGFVERCRTERDGETELLAAELYAAEDTALTVWYDAQTLCPQYAEFFRDGELCLRCRLREFTFR